MKYRKVLETYFNIFLGRRNRLENIWIIYEHPEN